MSPLCAVCEQCLLGTMVTATWHGQSDTGSCDSFDTYKVARPSSDVNVLTTGGNTHTQTTDWFKHHKGYELRKAATHFPIYK